MQVVELVMEQLMVQVVMWRCVVLLVDFAVGSEIGGKVLMEEAGTEVLMMEVLTGQVVMLTCLVLMVEAAVGSEIAG